MTEFEEIEHTADWAIRVRARDERELFVGAARGMFSLLTDLSRITADQQFQVELQAIDLETLLIDWLNELLFLAEENEIVCLEFQLQDLRVDHGASLRARVHGGRPAQLLKTIKAATFSSLSIQRDAEGVTTDLVFDV